MIRCPRCDTQASGAFCPNCGAALTARSCPSCGAALEPGARFCSSCGAGAGAIPGRPGPDGWRRFVPIGVAGAAVVALVLLLARSEAAPRPAAPSEPEAAGPAAGTPPDLSTMTPRERFDRLYDRVMRASETGDQATVDRFGPMALAAYGMLDTVDTDARYHAALLRLHGGDAAGAKLLADSMVTTERAHLFGYLARGMVARWNGDSTALKAAYKEYLARYDTEVAKKLEEYVSHRIMVDRFRDDAKAALAKGGA